MTFARLIASTAFALTLTACGGGPIELVGEYTTSFAFDESITEESWGTTSIEDYDNGDNWAVTQNPADAMFGANLYLKHVWTEPAADGSFHYCIVDFNLPTLEAAQTSTQTADASDPDNSGCGGFSWTGMTKK